MQRVRRVPAFGFYFVLLLFGPSGVLAQDLVSITVTPPNPSVLSGFTQQFTATANYSDGSTQDVTNMASWASLATDIATVNSQGLATGATVGTTNVLANWRSVTGSTSLTVTPPALVSIAVAPSTPSVPVGWSQQLTATGTYGDGSTQDLTSTATWGSPNLSIATVNAAGLVSGFGQGQVTIQAAVGALSGTATLTVTKRNFFPVGMMRTPRRYHTATLLPNGKVLIVGGQAGNALTSAELYDPATGTFTATGSLTTERMNHTATLLNNGKVLIAGGERLFAGEIQTLASTELYDPASGTFSPAGNMTKDRTLHSATLLDNGMVLIAGGHYVLPHGAGGGPSPSELYDPSTGTFTRTAGDLVTPGRGGPSTKLNNGKVLFEGGYPESANAELYDPTSRTFAPTGSLNIGRSLHTATLLNNGTVFVAGGQCFTCSISAATSEIYDPSSGTFTTGATLNMGRVGHTATRLNDGTVLIVGGSGGGRYLGTAELYDPATQSFTAAGSLITSRGGHTATLLNDGTVLIAGGDLFPPQAEIYAPAARPAPYSLQITPANVSMLVSNSRQFTAVDNLGYPRLDATWAVSDPNKASITSDGAPTLTALAAGQVTLTATIGTISAQAQIIISSAVDITPGTVLWSSPSLPNFAPLQLVQAVPMPNAPTLYSTQLSSDRRQSLVQALTVDGTQLWQTTLPFLNNKSIPDDFGGLLVTEYQTDMCDGTERDPMTIVDLDPTTGLPKWGIAAQLTMGTYCNPFAPGIAIRPSDGVVIITGIGNTSGLPELLMVNGRTGAQIFPQITIPPSTYTNQDGSTVQGYSHIWTPFVDTDGSAYVEYQVAVHAYPPRITSATLYLLRIAPNGSTTTIQLSSTTEDKNLFPGPVIPDGQGGVVATWTISPANPPVPTHPYQAAHVVSGAVVATYDLPFTRTMYPVTFAKYPTLVLGENNNVFATDNATTDSVPKIASFDLNSGNVIWSYPAPTQSHQLGLLAASDGGGLVARQVSPAGAESIIRFDINGGATFDNWPTQVNPAPRGLDYFGSYAWLGASSVANSSYMAMAGDEVLFSVPSPYFEPQGRDKNNNAGPASIPVNVVHVQGTSVTEPIANQVNNAIKYWKKHAGLSFSWNAQVPDVPVCAVDVWGENCSQHSVDFVNLEEKRITDSQREVNRRFGQPSGLSLVFTREIDAILTDGTQLRPAEFTPYNDPTSRHYGNLEVYANTSAGLVAAHSMGHSFQLTHVSDTRNLMCGPTAGSDPPNCPNLPADRLTPEQMDKAKKNATEWIPRSQ